MSPIQISWLDIYIVTLFLGPRLPESRGSSNLGNISITASVIKICDVVHKILTNTVVHSIQSKSEGMQVELTIMSKLVHLSMSSIVLRISHNVHADPD